ncbi:Nucleolar GTP-binding protein [Spraguea lophii 42_110]|uniref:Nucleolar GTP-binding protein 2 n=1 Tax=Spraguea lophii (strain 42_110) TaxID=1358809 RepID=S7WAV3_SPRLO|nr:Nucleolar GTP-binding protein [Spraguea lophii 42_110]
MKENFYRSKAKVNYIKMLRSGKPTFNASGEIIKPGAFQRTEAPTSHIPPDRMWFQNSRIVNQSEIDKYKETVENKQPYKVVINRGIVPFSLFSDNTKKLKVKVNHQVIFGKNARRKKVNMESLVGLNSVNDKNTKIEENKNNYEDDIMRYKENCKSREEEHEVKVKENNYEKVKGQSRRIWNELYKVVDSSDVIAHVLDARDPMGTICICIEKYIKKNAPHKQIIYVLNKVDLIPTAITAKWLRILSKTHPTIAFHSNKLSYNYGRNNLVSLLRQYSKLYSHKKSISIGFIGYPNIGKSSIINILAKKDVCTVAPTAGETKTWQYITLMKRINLIDCPGIVPYTTEEEAVVRGAIRVEKLDMPELYINKLVEIAKEGISKKYSLEFKDADDLLDKFSERYKKYNKNGEKDIFTAAQIILNDWVKGKIAYFVKPPVDDIEKTS